MRRLLLILTLCLSALPAAGQRSFYFDKFPNYDDFSAPKPEGSTKIGRNDVKLTDAFLPLYPDGMPGATQADLYKLYEFYRSDPDGQKEWKNLQTAAIRYISAWDLRLPKGHGSQRYVYATSALRPLGLVYMFTGNPLISTFIRAHLHKIASYPIDFWVHAELRGLNPEHPEGSMETAYLNKALPYALAAVRKDMTPEEIRFGEEAWYERGPKTALNWLEKPRKNNFTALATTSSLYAAQYFHDEPAKARVRGIMKQYIDDSLETDGSYAEGYGYLDYPVSYLWDAVLVLSPEEIRAVFGDSPLRYSMDWRVYGMLFDHEPDGKFGVMRLNFCDSFYGARGAYGTDKTSRLVELLYRSGVAAWLRQRYHSRECGESILLAAKLEREKPAPMSPAQAGLPTARCFQSGDCYIRDGWDDEGIVFALRAGDCGSRVGYGHNRPELNSMALGAFGEYILVTPGSASYRSRIHFEYDQLTRSANTVTIDGKNQKWMGGAAYVKGRWDNRPYIVKGFPHAVVTRFEQLPDGGTLLRSDATDAYHIDMAEAWRAVRFVPEGGFFIVHDRMTPAESAPHTYDYRLHFFNRDDKTVVEGDAALLRILRPKAELYVAVRSKAKPTLLREQGYLHAPTGRDYSENGPQQGKPGSAIEMDWQTRGDGLDICTVLYPKRPGDKAPRIKFGKGKVTVDGKSYPIPE